MDETAIFKLSYGLFFLGTEHHGIKNICVVNTVAQITQEPLKVSVTVIKGGYTHDLIEKSGKFSVGVMDESVSFDDVAHFGMNSGRSMDKNAGYSIKIDCLGNALFDMGCCASYACRVTGAVDVGTHTIFLADLVDAQTLSNIAPLTYAAYREMKSGKYSSAQSTIAAPAKAQWQCKICHWIYDGEIPFEELPDSWLCPVCKRPKTDFVKL